MRIRCLFATLLALYAPQRAEAKLKIAATTARLAAIVSAVGGEQVEVRALSLATQDPHYVDAKPDMVLYLSRADALFVVGLQLEKAWLDVLVRGSRNAAIAPGGSDYVDCSRFAKVIDVPQSVDRRRGDIHPGGDPHYLLDPANAQRVALAVYKFLIRKDPAHVAAYKRQVVQFLKSLRQKTALWRQLFARHRGRGVLSYHRSVKYLTAFLGLTLVAQLEPKPGIPPNPGHLRSVIAAARTAGAKVILNEVYYSKASASFVAKQLGGQVIVFNGGPRNGESFIAYLDKLISRVDEALR